MPQQFFFFFFVAILPWWWGWKRKLGLFGLWRQQLTMELCLCKGNQRDPFACLSPLPCDVKKRVVCRGAYTGPTHVLGLYVLTQFKKSVKYILFFRSYQPMLKFFGIAAWMNCNKVLGYYKYWTFEIWSFVISENEVVS